MSKRLQILILCLSFVISGCNEIIEINGIFLNRLNTSNYLETQLVIVVKNNEGEFVQNLEVSVINLHSKEQITLPKLTLSNNPVIFIFPDELIVDVCDTTQKLLIKISYSNVYYFAKELNISDINNKIVVIEFKAENIPQDLPQKIN